MWMLGVGFKGEMIRYLCVCVILKVQTGMCVYKVWDQTENFIFFLLLYLEIDKVIEKLGHTINI